MILGQLELDSLDLHTFICQYQFTLVTCVYWLHIQCPLFYNKTYPSQAVISVLAVLRPIYTGRLSADLSGGPGFGRWERGEGEVCAREGRRYTSSVFMLCEGREEG